LSSTSFGELETAAAPLPARLHRIGCAWTPQQTCHRDARDWFQHDYRLTATTGRALCLYSVRHARRDQNGK
jgi:formylglycine-generating enzyme required for sulfatase activity